MSYTSLNPATGQVTQTFPGHDDRELERRLDLAARAFRDHRSGSLERRAGAMVKAGEILDAEKRSFGQIITEEMGKTLSSAVVEIEKCAFACRHYAKEAATYLADEPLPAERSESFARYLPIGPVLAVMPWNFPFWQVVRFAAPALMVGNVGLLKHAHNVPRCALALEDLFRRAGFAEGVFQTLLIDTDGAARVIADPRVAAVTLTGSEKAGASVASNAGAHLKKTVLELGGSDAFVVMPSADIDAAAAIAVTARTISAGQSCIAAKRFIVHRDVYARFEERFVDGMRRLRVGDPMREDVDMGPLAGADILEKLDQQVQRTVAAGARVLLGGKRAAGSGFFYPPTVLVDVPFESPAWREEVFGPVAPLVRVDGIDEAIRLANDSPYGLGSSAWTRDAAEERRFIDEIEAGTTCINEMVASDPRRPFGGVKNSGYGRELGADGIREFTNKKTVYVNRAERARGSSSE